MSAKILIIDDSKIIRLIVARVLQPYDCILMQAVNGEEGLIAAAREKPELILLDFNMPKLDGSEVLARLRADAAIKSIPVIMLTTVSTKEIVVRIAKLGVRDYLIKPFQEEALLERVRRVLPLKTKEEAVGRKRRVDDAIHVVVVDDKPAIVEQIRTGLAPWLVTGAEDPAKAVETCQQKPADCILVSLALPNAGAPNFVQSLRAYAATATVPVYALGIKSSLPEAAELAEMGFAGSATKPIDAAELKESIIRTLKLETAYKYFQSVEGTLVLGLPKVVDPPAARAILADLDKQLIEAVEGGGDRVVVDLRAIEEPTLAVAELVLSINKAAEKYALKHAVAAPQAIMAKCRMFEEARGWIFAGSVAEAAALLH